MTARTGILSLFMTAALAIGRAQTPAPSQSPEDLKLRANDVLNVVVTDQPNLTKSYPITSEGTVIIPLVGSMDVAGKTVDEFESELRQRLAVYLKSPKIEVTLERPKRVFVFGGVTAPGMYQLTSNMTLLEVLARAGYSGASEVVIVRNRGTAPPAVPEDNAQVIRVNLREFERDLETGELSRNVVLEDGDTIYVPRFDPNRIYVSGEVRTPGAYSVPEKTTVLQAMTLAGGPTENAALGRVRVFRLVNGKQVTLDVKLDDLVRPADTIVVPRRRF